MDVNSVGKTGVGVFKNSTITANSKGVNVNKKTYTDPSGKVFSLEPAKESFGFAKSFGKKLLANEALWKFLKIGLGVLGAVVVLGALCSPAAPFIFGTLLPFLLIGLATAGTGVTLYAAADSAHGSLNDKFNGKQNGGSTEPKFKIGEEIQLSSLEQVRADTENVRAQIENLKAQAALARELKDARIELAESTNELVALQSGQAANDTGARRLREKHAALKGELKAETDPAAKKAIQLKIAGLFEEAMNRRDTI